MKALPFCLIVVALSGLSLGCASTEPNYFPTIGLQLPPKKSAEEVEARFQPPERAYYIIGLLEVRGSKSWGKIIRKSTKQAAAVGGDFVWIVNTRVEKQSIDIPAFATYSSSGSAYASGYGNSFNASANSQASGFAMGPQHYTVEHGAMITCVGVYYPSRLGINFDKDKSPKFIVSGFVYNSPAEKSGIQIGDELIAVDGIGVNADALPKHLLQVQPSRKMQVALVRNGERMVVDVETMAN